MDGEKEIMRNLGLPCDCSWPPVLPPVPGLVGAGGTPSTGVVVFRTVDA